jgi:branched-chain amino acid transport system permease protein
MKLKLKRNNYLTIAAIAAFIVLLFVVDLFLDAYTKRIFNLCAVYIVLALSLNLINGFTGLFSLGHAGFMAVGAYVCALLTMSASQKDMNFFLTPITPFLHGITLPFLPALLIAGLVTALFGFLIGAPVLRLRDDYLAIATLGFAEIIRVLITNFQPITNGAQGLKGLPKYAGTWAVWGCAALATIFMILLMRSSFGRAIKAVRDDEIAAEAMGVNVFRVKVVSFTTASFMAGVGGALMGHMITTIDPKMFTFTLTYNIVLIVVLGGSGSISGSIIGAVAVTIGMELLRFLDEPMDFIVFKTGGLPGLRMVVFSILLMAVVIFRQRGLMGNKELSWGMLGDAFRKLKGIGKAKAAGRE